MTHPPMVAVVGAGFGGLGAAYKLARAGVRVHVYEGSPRGGGLAEGVPLEGGPEAKAGTLKSAPIERFYHHLFTSDSVFIATLKELGIENRLRFFPSTNGFWHQGRIYDISRPTGLLKFSVLSVKDRIRLGAFILRERSRKDWRALDEISAREWVVSHAGENAFRVVWEPLLRAKFGDQADSISAAWLWSKIRLRSSSRKGWGGERLGYVQGGFDFVAQSLIREIERHNGRFFWGRNVTEIHPLSKGLRLVTAGRRQTYDAIVLTVAPEIAHRVVHGFTPSEQARLGTIRHQANICVVLTLKESISPVYWLSIGDASFPFVAVIEHTRMIPREWYKGKHIVYLSRYTDPSDRWYTAPDKEILDEIPRQLRRIFPRFSAHFIEHSLISRARFAQPITPVGFGKQIPPGETSIPGLYLASMAQIYPIDRGTNYALKQGFEVAEQVFEFIKKRV